MVDAEISRNYFAKRRESKLCFTSASSRDQRGGTVMRASGAPDKVNTRSIEQFIFSPRDVCSPKKMFQARLPRSFILTLTLGMKDRPKL